MTLAQVIKTITRHGLERLGRYYGVYEAFVVENKDPSNLGRLRLRIPIIHGAGSGAQLVWAQSINQWVGKGYGTFILPKVGDRVMVQFKHGSARFPMWSHGFRIQGDIPERYLSDSVYGIKTPNGIEIFIDDVNKHVTVLNPDGKTIFNTGDNGGLINVNELVNRLNTIENKLNDTISELKSHIHVPSSLGVPTTPALDSSQLPLVIPSIDNTEVGDIEDNKVLH